MEKLITDGDKVGVKYIGRLNNGEVFDSCDENSIFEFIVGTSQVIPGFENAVLGKKVGDKITANILRHEAYGDIREDLVALVPVEQIGSPVEIGQTLQAANSNGDTILCKVVDLTQTHVKIDANHPLAGKDLVFEIEILQVNN